MLEQVSVAIIGGGPAGLTCGIYLARAGIDCQVFEPAVAGGMVFMVHQIENYPGFPEGISGRELAGKMEAQAKKFGVKIIPSAITRIQKREKDFQLETSEGKELVAKAVVMATGSKPKKLGIPGEAEFFGRGVSYCATCDGNFFRGEEVAVVGGGDSALQEALYLSAICQKVYIVHRREQLRAKKILEERVKSQANIKLLLNSLPEEVLADENKMVKGLKLRDKISGKEDILRVTGIFFYVGMMPETSLVKDLVELNSEGFIKAGEDTKTSVPGIFAIGDVREKKVRQIASAVADGCNASFAIEEYFLERK